MQLLTVNWATKCVSRGDTKRGVTAIANRRNMLLSVLGKCLTSGNGLWKLVTNQKKLTTILQIYWLLQTLFSWTFFFFFSNWNHRGELMGLCCTWLWVMKPRCIILTWRQRLIPWLGSIYDHRKKLTAIVLLHTKRYAAHGFHNT